ncbi:PRD domain-containing protein [Anoxybacterium hadale]|uniref:PRD domain-containing protein n=1 Tax=Anoxybacterium hadale TaxID=3408580 RepID=A0ACD1AHK8_9FIRM|nr:PRD domain-containing protein [Clostridiales bacterium]
MSDSMHMQLLKHLETLSSRTDWNQLEDHTAGSIAGLLGISRTLASQYLNEEAAAGTLVKVNTRPVYFFHRQALLGGRGEALLDPVYPSVQELYAAVLSLQPETGVFDKLIGSEGSLRYNVEQCKAAISYPGNGLPILLWGPTGTGKSFLAQIMHEYAVQKGIVGSDGRFVAVNCSEYADNPDFFLTNLFGYVRGAYTGAERDRKGLLSLADGGVLFLDEVHCLSNECQEKLFHFMDKRSYHMVGDNEKSYTANVRLILATTEDPAQTLLRTLVRRIPMTTILPSLAKRSLREKKELLYHQLAAESVRIRRDITIRFEAHQMILNYSFPENVGQLVNCISICVANAIITAEPDQSLEIQVRHLPNYILQDHYTIPPQLQMLKKNVLDLDQIRSELQQEQKLFLLNRDILQGNGTIAEVDENPEKFFSLIQLRMEQYFDELYQETKNRGQNPYAAFCHGIVKGICANLSQRMGTVIQEHDLENLCLMVDDFLDNFTICTPLAKKNEVLIRSILDQFKGYSSETFGMTQEFASQLAAGLNCVIPPLFLLDLNICIHSFTPFVNWNRTVGIIIAHGYSTASSIAATGNHLLGQHVFNAIDMPMEVHSGIVAAKLTDYLRNLRGAKDVIVLVDMGSLEQIYKNISCEDNMNLGFINNLSMKLVLNVGSMMIRDVPVKNILLSCCADPVQYEYVFQENRKKPNVILSVCATGIATAEKISQLFTQSFPAKVDVSVITYNYNSLIASGKLSPVFEKNNVLFIVGTQDPGIPGYPFLALEDILEQRNMNYIDKQLSIFMSKAELQTFNNNLLKNFSLQNLLSQLTILNPEKLMGFVETIITKMQQGTNMKFTNAVILGLYIHISCLIERLITEKYAVNHKDLDDFERHHQDFISMTLSSFQEVEKNYGVAIPVSEIAYLYDYIYRA